MTKPGKPAAGVSGWLFLFTSIQVIRFYAASHSACAAIRAFEPVTDGTGNIRLAVEVSAAIPALMHIG